MGPAGSHAVVGVVGDFDWTHLNANQQEVMTFPGFPGYTLGANWRF